jgi:hypothetical protein
MFVRIQRNGNRHYLLIVENMRANGRVKQKVIHRLGRLDTLVASGQLDSLLGSMQRFSEKLSVLGSYTRGEIKASQTSKIGPALIFDRVWQELGIKRVIEQLLQARKYGFEVERAIFLTVLHRLFAPGSDRAAERWREDYRIMGTEALELHHLYRTMAWLGEPLSDGEQRPGNGFSPRCIKDRIEEALFAKRRDLFSGLDLVFFDTTSIYFEGAGGETLGQHGYSKDHRPDLKQMVVGMVIDNAGRPLCTELWPGNVTDVRALVPVVERLKERFGIERICVVADRGMISAKTQQELDSRGWFYILGVRMRRCTEVKHEVLGRAGRYRQVPVQRSTGTDSTVLKVKEVVVNQRRYMVCLNEDQAAKDSHDRKVIVESLRDALKRGAKSLIGNKGYRRYVSGSGQRFNVDEDKIKADERFDGKWVLTTNTQLPAEEVALKYKQLWMVEAVFRSMKSTLRTRPIYHKCDETIRGHVFCSFLALLLRQGLEDRLAAAGVEVEWAELLRALERLQEIEIHVGAKHYVLRTEAQGAVAKVFRACSVALPPVLRQC